MAPYTFRQYAIAFLIVGLSLGLIQSIHAGARTAKPKGRQNQPASKPKIARGAKAGTRTPQRAPKLSRRAVACAPCNAATASKSKKRAVKNMAKVMEVPCKPRGYVDPAISKHLNAALAEMRRAGITPHITSTWRSSKDQARLHRCSLSRRCRHANPGLYRALPPGNSVHEAGLAVDISGVATGPRGAKRLTPQGRRIVAIMERHGFDWKYGLADPVHFESDPRKHGYRSLQQAINRNQARCQVRFVTASKTRQKAPVKKNVQSLKGERAAGRPKVNKRPSLQANSKKTVRRSAGA